MERADFQHLLRQRGNELYRDMPWRRDTRPYYVLVSELMLQQTQVARVESKFQEFIARFPDEVTLASASLAEVLALWQGLGYNRRAKFLHASAMMVTQELGGAIPDNESDLRRLPGVGVNTAGAILAYAFNQPALFIETNIRTVYIHHFFNNTTSVSDQQIRELLSETIDHDNPRRFYQNLMDYGAWLKGQGVRNSAQSRQYKKQSSLQGSVRELRGEMIRALLSSMLSMIEFEKQFSNDSRYRAALDGLLRDGLVERNENCIRLTR
ncbi:MAG TPA: hypothetical protein PKA97_00395 [Candidatus Nanoperiomorbaceae bacterium]|nr:hypothetical protein [Candidatus Nanoperiomorbaceae bacterium]